MSKLIAVRLPDNLAEALSKNAEQTGQSISQIMIQGLEMVLFNIAPVGKVAMLDLAQDMREYVQAAKKTETLQLDKFEDKYIKVAYLPIHAETCKCLICKPPKP